jgi:hypothetical protein
VNIEIESLNQKPRSQLISSCEMHANPAERHSASKASAVTSSERQADRSTTSPLRISGPSNGPGARRARSATRRYLPMFEWWMNPTPSGVSLSLNWRRYAASTSSSTWTSESKLTTRSMDSSRTMSNERPSLTWYSMLRELAKRSRQ